MVKKYESKKQENLEDLLSEESLNDLQGKIDVAKKNNTKKVPEREFAGGDVNVKGQQAPTPNNKKKPKKKRPPKKIETLQDYEEQLAYEQSDDFLEELEREEEERNFFKDASNVKDVLDMVSFQDVSDLSSITIIDPDRTSRTNENLNFTINAKATYQIVLNQSAYIAHMEGLRLKDVFSIAGSTGDSYASKLRKYQTYYKKMNSNTIGLTSFEEWAKKTSLYDMDTIQFGIFCQTFPGDTDFNITCSHCQQTMKNVKVSNDQLIAVKDDEAYAQLNRVINSIKDPESCAKYSLVNKVERFQLPFSKAIVDIRIPTVHDQLDILKKIREEDLPKVREYLEIMYFIKDVMIVDLAATREQGKPVFNKLKDENELVLFLSNMHLDDIEVLNHKVEDKDEKYRIEYKIKSFECQNPKCKKQTGDISIDIDELLFDQAVGKIV